jgi:Serine dehydrogenase proteinase
MGDEDRDRERDPRGHGQVPEGKAGVIPDSPVAIGPPLELPRQTPLYHAQHAERYARQTLIKHYEARFGCRLVVLVDEIFPEIVTIFEELIHDADPLKDLHLLLNTLGGDGETAVRLVRSAQARCRELTVIVPNEAKSAGTILLMGAYRIVLGPTSDLGPVDPQFQNPQGPGLYSAKDLIAAVEAAEASISSEPNTYPLHVSLLADFTGVMAQQARSALDRTNDLVKEALRSNPDRSEEEVKRLAESLQETLVKVPREHSAVFGARDAERAGLPILVADPRGEQWQVIWRLWAKYFALDAYVCEGRLASQVTPRTPS